MQVIPNRTFLLRQDDLEGGKKKDVIAKRGIKIDVKESEAIKFWGCLDLDEKQKKTLLNISRTQKLTRKV